MKRGVVWLVVLFSQASLGSISHINDIPDFTQTDIRGSDSGNGQQYCAPVAVSNSLVWLSRSASRQIAIVKKLASKPYMNTSLENGTGTTGVLRGVDKMAKELFGGYEKLVYEGWRKHPALYSQGVKVPTVGRLKSAISSQSAAWINVGWYTYEQEKDEYKRVGGHWVTLVGSTDNQLVVHDPAPRAGQRFANEFVDYRILKSGMLVGKKSGLPTPASGRIRLVEGMHVKSKADVGIIDGVVYLEL